MSGYFRVRDQLAAGDLRRVYWVCGEEQILVEDIVQAVVRAAEVAPMDVARLDAEADHHRDIWATANLYPTFPGGRRVVVVRNANRIEDWRPLGWTGHQALQGLHWVFVSAESDYSLKEQPHVKRISSAGRAVKCTLNIEEKVVWLREVKGVDGPVARRLLDRVAGSLSAAHQVVMKAEVLRKPLDDRLVAALTVPDAGDEYVDALTAVQKARAAEIAERIPEVEISEVLSKVELRLEALEVVHRVKKRGEGKRTASRELGPSRQWLVGYVWDHSASYDARTVGRRVRALSMASHAREDWADEGVLETLAVLW